jgi:amino acid adenylation domain-containing protein
MDSHHVSTPESPQNLRQRIASLSPAKRALLELVLRQQNATPTSLQSIPRRDPRHPVPLSFAQQRLWFLHQVDPQSSLYNMGKALRLSGSLNLQALQNTLDAIVARHEVLRTTFTAVDGVPVQVIAPSHPVRIAVIDLSHLPSAERDAEAERVTRQEAERPFHMASDPMLRATVLRLEPQEHILLLANHHIVSDGWSVAILAREFSVLYNAYATGQRHRPPELPIQYADFAVWQRQWLQGDVLDTHLTYWKQQLHGLPPVLELPSDRPRPPMESFRGRTHAFELPHDLTQALKDLGQREGVTLFMTLLTSFTILLSRYTGRDDIVVGSPIANRNRIEVEGLIGLFANTLVLRTDLSGAPSCRELLQRVRRVALEAYVHQDVPFEKLVEELNPPRSLSHHPLFQVLFVLQNTPEQPFELTGLDVQPLKVGRERALVDLALAMSESNGCLKGALSYNTDLFDTATIERMAGQIQTLLSGIVADPERSIATLPLLTETERHQLLHVWNATQSDYPRASTIHRLFEAQVARTPDAVALVYGETQWTYRELNARANQLARYLRKQAVGAEAMVAVCMQRSPAMMVSLLGILKAGGAYLPLNPSYPSERLTFMLEDAQPALIVTQQQMLGQLPPHQVRVLCVDSAWDTICQEREADLPHAVTADSVAYVFYTSGSTGMPKGVMGSHRGLVNLSQAMAQQFDLQGQDRIMQFSVPSFDILLEEIFPTWIRGATLVLQTEDVASSIPVFLAAVRQGGITVLDLPTAFWHVLVDVLEVSGESLPETLRLVVVGGEKASAAVFSKWRKLAGERIRWLNTYGPTETTVTSTVYEPPRASDPGPNGSEVPIGRPIANTQIYLLDRHRQPVPIGVPGELYIGGDGVTQGYLNRAELTAERFIPNPVDGGAKARLYRTGDLARYRPDGNLEFLGRLDNQLKIRGFRIEPGEIEAVLGQHPAVCEAVVLTREDEPGDKRLVAYVVSTQQPTPTTRELRLFLQEKFPDYMVPSAFVVLDALPLTPNGKVDRRRLPAPEPIRPALETTFVPPRNPIEQAVAKIWAEILRLDHVGIYDNFFELGGHSLLAIQLMSRVRGTFHVELPLRALFHLPTVAALGELVVTYESVPGQSAAIARVLAKMETMSADDMRAMLQQKKGARG